MEKKQPTTEPELTVQIGSIIAEGNAERIEQAKAELPAGARRLVDHISDLLLKNPHKIVEAMAAAVKLAAEEISKITGEPSYEVGAKLMMQVGSLVMKTDDDGITSLFALGLSEAITSFYKQGCQKQKEENEARVAQDKEA